MKNKLLLIFVLLNFCSDAQKTDSLKVFTGEEWTWQRVLVVEHDTVEGKSIAVYASDTSVIAYEKNYYFGFITGVYKSYYPDGSLMEKIIYQKGMKNGEYELRDREGKVLAKGEYKNDIKHGYWSDVPCRFYGRYKNGMRNGKWKWYYDDFSFHTYLYKKGNLVKQSAQLPSCRMISE